MTDVQILPSSRSLELDLQSKDVAADAKDSNSQEVYSDFGFIALLGLIQRLGINILPIAPDSLLSGLGQGGQGEISQARVNARAGFAFKHFNHYKSDPFKDVIRELMVLGDALGRNHQHIVNFIGICWDIPRDNQVWPVLVLEKTDFGDLHQFVRSSKGKDLSLEARVKICVDVAIAIKDMHRDRENKH
jgi:hypothetical protein